MSDNLRCPHNTGHACVNEDRPISFSKKYNCVLAPCAYIAQLNHCLESEEQHKAIQQELEAIKFNIGATEDEDDPIAVTLHDIWQQLEWIRNNIGATEDEDSSISVTLQDILEALPSDEFLQYIRDNI